MSNEETYAINRLHELGGLLEKTRLYREVLDQVVYLEQDIIGHSFCDAWFCLYIHVVYPLAVVMGYQQLTLCPVTCSDKVGCSWRHFSWAYGQRGSKRHPLGR